MIKIITKCRICAGTELTSLFLLKNQALTGVFPKSKNEKITTGSVELIKCTNLGGCGLVQLRQSYNLDEMYGLNYGYRSGLNASMVHHLHLKVANILRMNILQKNDLILDIGSNDCTTLKAYPKNKFELVGIDPTGNKFSKYYPKEIRLISDYFSLDAIVNFLGNKKAKVITSFSMFYDLEDPISFAKEIERVLADDGIWVFEQSYLPAMLRTNSFDTICHEHLEFYALKQINWIAEKANLKILDVEFNEINGGSFSVICSKISAKYEPNWECIKQIIEEEKRLGLDDISVFEAFKTRIESAKTELMGFLHEAKLNGKKVCGLGASTKGNVLLQYYGINDSLISAIAEVNPDKFGSFTPGTNIPLLPEEEVLNSNPDYLLVLPWHFRSFFEQLPILRGRKLVFPLPKFEIFQL